LTKPIGGFFELETCLGGDRELHPEATRMSLGRAALRLVLERMRPTRVWVPFYICTAVLQTLEEVGIPFAFYPLSEELSPLDEWRLSPDEYVVVVNYFGIKGASVADYARGLGQQVIIDNTQAFFAGRYDGVFSFNSARKAFGVPDGSYLYGPEPIHPPDEENHTASMVHLELRAAGDLRRGYAAFTAYEHALTSDIRRMSRLSQALLRRVDYAAAGKRRRRNFAAYDDALGPVNRWSCRLGVDDVPFCYPFLPSVAVDRAALAQQAIFVPMFWPEVAERPGAGFARERDFARRLLPLPLDHRYDDDDIGRVIAAVRAQL
jgi:hypothetical protein